MSNWPRQSAMTAFFGNPDANGDGKADAKWEAENLVFITPPYQMYFGGKPINRIRCHRLVADSLTRILTRIGKEVPRETIVRCQLDQFGGVYEFRVKRGNSKSLSTHALACAIDLAPALNGFKVRYGSRSNMMPMQVVKIFEAEGWVWGGLWTNGDAMHFQAATIG